MGKPVTTTDGIRSDLHGRRSDLSERAGKLYKNTRHAGKLSMKHRMRKVRANRLSMFQTASASPGGGAVHARLATLMTITTPAPGGGAVESSEGMGDYYLNHSRDGLLLHVVGVL